MDPITLLVVGGALALAVGAGGKRRRALRSSSPSRSPSTRPAAAPDPAPPPRPTAEPAYIVVGRGVEDLRPEALDALQRWALAVTARTGRRPEITSGYRSPERQAAAMLEKLRLGDDLLALYRDDDTIRLLLSLPPTVEAWAPVLEERPVSDHQSGLAWDVRTRDRSDADVAAMVELARAAGLDPLVEAKPKHLHVELPG
jgi:hypothetical protein